MSDCNYCHTEIKESVPSMSQMLCKNLPCGCVFNLVNHRLVHQETNNAIKEIKDSSDFNITTKHYNWPDSETNVHHLVKISMTRNGETFNVVNNLSCFQGGQNCLNVLQPTINELVHRLYPESFSTENILLNKIKELENQLKGLKHHYQELINAKTNTIG